MFKIHENYQSMSMIYKYLSHPYPQYGKPWQIMASSVVFVVLVLIVFEPFHYRLDSIFQFWILIHFVLITVFGTAVPLILFPKVFKGFYAPDKWTIGKHIANNLLFVLLLSIEIIVYEQILLPGLNIEHTSISFLGEGYTRIILTDLLVAFAIAVAPIGFTFVLTRIAVLNQNLQDALVLNNVLSDRIKSEIREDEQTVTLTGSTKEQLKTNPDNILYIEAADNYMDIYYLEEGEVKHKLLRSTIKQIEEQLNNYGFFVRCHRAYIINMNHIDSIEGNAKGYKLQLLNVSKEIPVSRTYIQVLKERIM